MKNRLSFIAMVLSSLILFSNCSLVDITDESKINAPDVNQSVGGLTITLKNSFQDVMYINIFRQDITGCVSESQYVEPIENIGVVFPVNNNTTFVYEDSTIFQGNTYRYYARICDKVEGYFNTEWTDGIKVINGLEPGATKSVVYGVSSASQFNYYPEEKKLVFTGILTNPNAISNFEAEYKPALILTNKTVTQAVKLEELVNGTNIYLTNILPFEFYNSEIQVLGIVAQKEEKVEVAEGKHKVKRVIWTGIKPIPVFDEMNYPLTDNIIDFRLEYSDSGYDYSSK